MKFKTILLLIHQMDNLHMQTTVSPTSRSCRAIRTYTYTTYKYNTTSPLNTQHPFYCVPEPSTVIGYPEEMAGFPSTKPALLWDKFQWTP